MLFGSTQSQFDLSCSTRPRKARAGAERFRRTLRTRSDCSPGTGPGPERPQNWGHPPTRRRRPAQPQKQPLVWEDSPSKTAPPAGCSPHRDPLRRRPPPPAGSAEGTADPPAAQRCCRATTRCTCRRGMVGFKTAAASFSCDDVTEGFEFTW